MLERPERLHLHLFCLFSRELEYFAINLFGLNETIISMAHVPTLFPPLESIIEPLDNSDDSLAVLSIAKELHQKFQEALSTTDIKHDSLIPSELLPGVKKVTGEKVKIDPLKRLLSVEEASSSESSEETDDQEEEEAVEDEEAGGDYLVSHFDNGENDDEGDEEGDDDVI